MASDPNIKLNSNGHRNNASQLRGTGYAPADPTLPPYSDPQGGLLAPPPQHIQNRHSRNLGATFNNENCEAPILNGPTKVERVGNSQTTNNGATTNTFGGMRFTNNSQYHGNAKHYNPVGDGMHIVMNENSSPSRMEANAPQAEALGRDAQQPPISQRPAEMGTQDINQTTQDSNQRARERDQIAEENRRRALAEENRQRAEKNRQRAREREQGAQEASQNAQRKPAAPTPAPPPSGPRLPQQSTQAHPPSGPSAFARPTVPPPSPSLGPYNPPPKATPTRPCGARTYVPMPAPPPGVAGSNSSLGSGRSTPATPKTPVSAPQPSTYAYPSPSSISHSPTVRQPAPAVPPASYRYVDSHNIGPTWNTENAKGPVFNGGVTFGGGASARQLAGGSDEMGEEDDEDEDDGEDEEQQRQQQRPPTQRPYMSPQSEQRPLGSPFQESYDPRGSAMGGYAKGPRQHSEFLPQQYQHAPAPTQQAWNARARPPHPTSQMPPPPPQHQPQYPPEASTAPNSPWSTQNRSSHPGSRPYTPPPHPEPYRGRRDYSSSPRRYEPVPPYCPPMMPGAVMPVSLAVPVQPIYVMSPGYPYQHYLPQPPPPPPYYGRPPSPSRSRGDYYEDRRYYRSRSPSRDRDYERSESRGTPFASPEARSSRRYLDSREPSPESSYRKSGGYPSSDDEEYEEGRRRPLHRQRRRMQNSPAGCEHCSSRGDDDDSFTGEGSVGIPIHIQAPTSTFNTPQTRRGTPLPPAEVPLQNRTPEGGPLAPLLLSPQKAPVAFSASGEGGKPYMLQCTIKGVSSIHIQVG
ncbi:hypothetical protein D9611_000609 [Ephemerocybe angulata]|uniref:Uncharacterized protein n=1 Tax=Ephemerocybe angulata TaxID=980116 RepID=A0A8H5F794_9AGAR|nr:hypothetical protein D9611_000609 [Tulosesus angulatus]